MQPVRNKPAHADQKLRRHGMAGITQQPKNQKEAVETVQPKQQLPSQRCVVAAQGQFQLQQQKQTLLFVEKLLLAALSVFSLRVLHNRVLHDQLHNLFHLLDSSDEQLADHFEFNRIDLNR